MQWSKLNRPSSQRNASISYQYQITNEIKLYRTVHFHESNINSDWLKNLRYVNILSVHSVVYLHSVLLRVIIMRPWGYILSCSYQPCTTSATLSSPGNGYLWQSPSRLWARMPKLSWVTVSPGLSPLFMYLLLEALRHKFIMLYIRSRIIFGAGRGLFWRFRMAATRCCSGRFS